MAFGKKEIVEITPPKFKTGVFNVIGVTQLVMHKFSSKMRLQMKAKQEAGSSAKTNRRRDPKDFDDCYKQAFHVSTEGWYGIPATAFKNAMVTACKLVGFVMTRAKIAIFVEADGVDADEGVGLLKIEGKPDRLEMIVRLETGVPDICVRPRWEKWSLKLRVTFDESILTLNDITNLLVRAGLQVGVGEGRPDSSKSCGMGWGTFRVEGKGEKNAGK